MSTEQKINAAISDGIANIPKMKKAMSAKDEVKEGGEVKKKKVEDKTVSQLLKRLFKGTTTPYYITLKCLALCAFILYIIVTIVCLKKIPKHKTKNSKSEKILNSTHKILTIVGGSLYLLFILAFLGIQDFVLAASINVLVIAALFILPKVLLFKNYDKLEGKQFLKYYTFDIMMISSFGCILIILALVSIFLSVNDIPLPLAEQTVKIKM